MRLGKFKIIGEHAVALPSLPTTKRDIFFYDLPSKDQYWQRDILIKQYRQIWFDFIPNFTKMYQSATIYNQDGFLVSLNDADSDYVDSIYLQEKDRRISGVWFFNNGEPTWITGDHYWFLMYARMQRHDGRGLYADYREFQADYAHLVHHCCVSHNILGLFCSKPKKTGITNFHWSGVYGNRSMLYANKNFGYMNIQQQQAAKTFNDYFMYSYNGIISPLRPAYKNLSEVEGTIVFGDKTYKNPKKARRPQTDEDDSLNSSVFCVPTKAKAFDVAVMAHICFDEPTKYKESFAEIWRTNKEAVKIQSKINGKAWLFNYTPEEDSQSFREARDVFWDSELRTITESSQGQTKSQLICHHIPAYASWEGAFDKYGKCDERRASKEIEFERNKVKSNPRSYQAIKRQYANDKKEAWVSGGAGSLLDNIRLTDILTDIEEEERVSPVPSYVNGHLKWTNELWNINRNLRKKGQFCPVKFVPLTPEEISKGEEGSIREYFPVPQKIQNIALKYGRDEWENLIAPPEFFNVLGADPVQHAAASEIIEGSKNSYHVMNRANEATDSLYGKVVTKIITHEYFDRPESPDDAFEDLLKLIIYTGALSAVEANAPYCATRLMEEGLGNFMLVKDENGIMTIWKRHMGLANEEDKTYHLLRTVVGTNTKDSTKEDFVRLIKEYIRVPEPGGKDYGKAIKSSRLINQLMNVDIVNTKIYDMFMSFGWNLLADEVYSNLLLNKTDDDLNPDYISAVLRALSPTG